MDITEPHNQSSKKLTRLLNQLKDKEALTRVKALESLTKLGPSVAFPELVKALSDKSPDVRSTAAEHLGLLGHKEAVEPLIGKLRDPNSEVRMRAAESLGILLTDKSSPISLIKRLYDSDKLVRIVVAESLGCIGDRRALPALWRAINDTSSLVRCYVAEAIGKLGSKKDVKKLEKALRHETSDAARIGFYQALYVQGQRDVLQPMLMLLQSNDYRVRCATANTLSEIIANKSDSLLALRTLRTALKQELTVAAKSSIRAAIRSLGRR